MPFVKSLDLAAPSWDLFLVLLFAIGSLVYGLTLGRDRIVVIMVSMYIGLAVVTNAPYLQTLTASLQVNQTSFRIGAFLGVFLLLFFMLSRNALIKSLEVTNLGGLGQTLLFSVLHVGLLISLVLSFLPAEALGHFSGQIRTVFVSDVARLAWLVTPVAAMMIFGNRRT